MVQSSSAEDRKLFSGFDSIRRKLLESDYADRMDKPLAYWALPSDRRLPLAFLGRTLRDLLATPYDELTRTRGVGQKKIGSLVKLLHRATTASPPSTPYGLESLSIEQTTVPGVASPDAPFDPEQVSEVMWEAWRATVLLHQLGDECLGRLAPSLRMLPTVIWNTRLGDYTDLTLAQVRELKTHGEKRVRVVLEVFHAVHRALHEVVPTPGLAIRLVPTVVPTCEAFVARVIRDNQRVTREILMEGLVRPLLKQVETDSSEMVFELARQRLGTDTPQRSVRDQAHELGVTRARVYQMLEDCGRVVSVRWPEGGSRIRSLDAYIAQDAKSLFRLVCQLFVPDRDGMESEDERWQPTAWDATETMSLTPEGT